MSSNQGPSLKNSTSAFTYSYPFTAHSCATLQSLPYGEAGLSFVDLLGRWRQSPVCSIPCPFGRR